MHFALDDQIASQPEAVRSLLKQIQVPTLNQDRPTIFTGIGTSLHACIIAAQWATELSGGALRPAVVNAHELALNSPIQAGDQIVVVSHRGNKRFPNEVLAKAQKAGATTIAISGEETNQIPVQRLVAEMARLKGTNPDAIHRDVEPWNTAMRLIRL